MYDVILLKAYLNWLCEYRFTPWIDSTFVPRVTTLLPRHLQTVSAISNSTEQSPSWKSISNNHSAREEVPPFPLRNPKFHYLVHKSLPPVSIPSQVNLVHSITPYFFKMHFDLILPSTPESSSGTLFPYSISTKILYKFIISPMRATCPAQVTLLDFIILLKGTNYEAPHYAIYSSLLLLHPS
jgi:hypothetical protein